MGLNISSWTAWLKHCQLLYYTRSALSSTKSIKETTYSSQLKGNLTYSCRQDGY